MLLLRSPRLIDPVTRTDRVADVLIDGGVIVRIAPRIAAPAGAEVRELRGTICAPGFFDLHVHFREPGGSASETIDTGVAAAAHGGFTGVLMMPNTSPPLDAPHLVAQVLARGAGGAVDVHTTGCISKDRAGRELAPLGGMVAAGARAFTDDGAAVASGALMRRAFEYAAMLDTVLIQHAEDHTLTGGGCMNEGEVSALLGMPGMPTVAEDVVVARDVLLADYLRGARYHVTHISSARAVEIVRRAKQAGLPVTADVTPHHLALTDDAVRTFDPNLRMNPPLRTAADVAALRAGLKDGTIDAIATDHAPHAPHLKDVDFAAAPFGVIGLETAVGVCVTHLVRTRVLTWAHLIATLSVKPRRILRLPELRLAAGRSANLTIVDPRRTWTVRETDLRSRSRNSPFLGATLTGKAVGIVTNGHAVWA